MAAADLHFCCQLLLLPRPANRSKAAHLLPALPAAAAVCGSVTRFPGRPGERVGLYCDIYGSVITTPSRPVSRRLIRVDDASTRAWSVFYKRLGTLKGAGSKFQGKKKRLRVSWAGCKPPKKTPPGRASVGEGDSSIGSPSPSGGPKADSSERASRSASAGSVPLASAGAKTREKPVGRWASVKSLPDCWIADTGCGFDILCGRWVALEDQARQTLIPSPPTFSGVGGSTAAKMKLQIKSPALGSAVEPYILPNTPDVISIGKRCVEQGWSFWWPPWSKRPILSPPKGKGKPIYLSVHGNIPYVRERASESRQAAPSPITNFALPEASTSPVTASGSSIGPGGSEWGYGCVSR